MTALAIKKKLDKYLPLFNYQTTGIAIGNSQHHI